VTDLLVLPEHRETMLRTAERIGIHAGTHTLHLVTTYSSREPFGYLVFWRTYADGREILGFPGDRPRSEELAIIGFSACGCEGCAAKIAEEILEKIKTDSMDVDEILIDMEIPCRSYRELCF